MLCQYSNDRAEALADDDFDAFPTADAADVEAETRRLLDIEGTLGTALGVAEFD